MNNLKRMAILLVVFALTVTVSVSFKGNDILRRAIILGIGVDSAEDGLCVTVEIVSPGNGSEQVGMFTKTATATGQTVGEALQSIAEKTGKEASLGQCVLLVYGEEFVQNDFSSVADYFAKSNSFKENAMVCCCKGTAKDLFNNSDAVTQSVSLALADKLKGISKDVALPANDLLKFARSQAELFQTGFLNYVYFEESPNSDTNNPTQGYFLCDRVAVFRQNRLVGILSQEETAGFAILSPKVVGDTFSVVEDDKLLTLRTNNKDVKKQQTNNSVNIAVTLSVGLSRTDSFGAGGSLSAKTEKLSQSILQQAKQQATQLAQLFLNKQVEWGFDIIGLHEVFRQKYGSAAASSLSMEDISVTLSVEVKE